MSWLPDGFRHPDRVDCSDGYHLRPIRADDVAIDYPAVMSSRAKLWDVYGTAWGWPPETMTYEQDRQDLRHHEEEMARGESFNYAILPREEDRLLGCVYIDPSEESDHDAVVSWWLIDELAESELATELRVFVPEWLRSAWPFERVYFGVR